MSQSDGSIVHVDFGNRSVVAVIHATSEQPLDEKIIRDYEVQRSIQLLHIALHNLILHAGREDAAEIASDILAQELAR